MSWKKYFELGCGGNKTGSTVYYEPLNINDYLTPQQMYTTTTTTTYRNKPHYHAARQGKRWKK